MNIKDIISKLLGGETLTDAEKQFAEGFDLQSITDKASASARRKAETEAQNLRTELEKAQATISEMESKGNAGNTELQKLQKQVAKLTAVNEENERKIAARTRKDAILAFAKANGVNAAEGVSATAFERLLDMSVGETDVTDEDAMKAVITAFKKDNPAMIADGGHGGVGGKGKPNGATGVNVTVNPWKKGSENLTEQMRIMQADPAEAQRLAAAEGVTL